MFPSKKLRLERTSFELCEELDFVQLFIKSKEELVNLLNEAKGKIRSSGMIWVSWPKKASKAVWFG